MVSGRSGWRVLVVVLGLAVAAPATAQLPSNSVPATVFSEGVLVGRYRYVERADGMKVEVRLNDDHSASYLVTSGAGDEEFITVTGYWSYDGRTIHIHNHTGPARLEPAAPPVRDPTVGLTVTATNADGTQAEGLGVTWPGSKSLFMLSEGRHSTPLGDEGLGTADRAFVVRASDDMVLSTVTLTPGGPNSFVFTYHPSDVEPFDIPAIALDERADRIEVELGTSYARMDRVSD